MNSSALILMIAVHSTVIFFTAYFFRAVLRAPKNAEPDSYDENDDE